MLVKHRPSLFSTSHVCALSPSNAVNFVYSDVTHTLGSSVYTFQICTPADLGTYGLKATEEETLIFEVSQ